MHPQQSDIPNHQKSAIDQPRLIFPREQILNLFDTINNLNDPIAKLKAFGAHGSPELASKINFCIGLIEAARSLLNSISFADLEKSTQLPYNQDIEPLNKFFTQMVDFIPNEVFLELIADSEISRQSRYFAVFLLKNIIKYPEKGMQERGEMFSMERAGFFLQAKKLREAGIVESFKILNHKNGLRLTRAAIFKTLEIILDESLKFNFNL